MAASKGLFIKRNILPYVAVVVAALIGFGVVFSLSQKDTSSSQAQAQECKDTCVELHEDKATPDTITVTVGSYVQFNSADGKSHSLSLGNGGEEHSHTGKFSSGEFKADEGWRVQFNEEGSFVFHDHLNPKISILVVVYTPGKDYKVQ